MTDTDTFGDWLANLNPIWWSTANVAEDEGTLPDTKGEPPAQVDLDDDPITGATTPDKEETP